MLTAVLVGCTAQPDPNATPTAVFSSDEEAFAAAEATYRAYVDALNAVASDDVDALDPANFLVGDALESHNQTERAFDDAKLRVEGNTRIVWITAGADSPGDSMSILVCLDVSATRIVDADGADQTPVGREETVLLQTTVVELDEVPAISKSVAVDQC
ncbi:hypothetical protein [Microbacterium sp. R86528]|uniref:hypothetical protein n=1 Tax=Microbacterium sp. R86528 TaxID=3093864 RepID=UPI0037C622C9